MKFGEENEWHVCPGSHNDHEKQVCENNVRVISELANAFNPVAAEGVMCRNMISIGWDGYLYDCDFNQMLELKLNHGAPNHISDFDWQKVLNREIIINQHCFGCTAGAGSSCGGSTTA